jgi:urease accessory protein
LLKITERVDQSTQQTADDCIELDYDDRKRGRLRTRSRLGKEIGLFLDRGRTMQEGDLLKAENGDLFRVKAADENVVKAQASNSLQFAKVCYHLGNRHVPLQIGDHWLRFQPDHVLEALCLHFGLKVRTETVPFQPESGAYANLSQHTHHHDAPLQHEPLHHKPQEQ